MPSAGPSYALGLSLLAAGAAMGGEAVGSVNAYGLVRLGGVPVPSGATVFAGQTISTGREGRALITLASRSAVALGPETRARVIGSSVVLDRGGGSPFVAGLKLEPASPTTAAEATSGARGRVSITVNAGMVRVIDPSGISLETIPAGRTFLFGLADQEGQGRSGGQAPGIPPEKKPGERKPGVEEPENKKKSYAAVYVLVAAAAGGAGAAVALSGKRGS